MSDTAKVLITEGLEKVSVNRLATFTIEADASLGSPSVEVLSPTRESLHVQIKQGLHGSYTAGFTPKDVGWYIYHGCVGCNCNMSFHDIINRNNCKKKMFT